MHRDEWLDKYIPKILGLAGVKRMPRRDREVLERALRVAFRLMYAFGWGQGSRARGFEQ